MNQDDMESRLSRIATRWSLLREAHPSRQCDARQVYADLFERYQRAVFRYLVGALRDPDAAEEVFQEFSLRLVEGRFRGADPTKGRFRDYLKTTLGRLIVDHYRRVRRRGVPIGDDMHRLDEADRAESEADELFETNWRDELLAHAWKSLEDYERKTGRPYYTVLRRRTRYPKETSAEAAKALNDNASTTRPFTATSVRKTLQRARECFAEGLLEEVAVSLGTDGYESLERELIALRLLPYCRTALRRRRDPP